MAGSTDGVNLIQKKIWEGSLALEIRLSPSECRSFDQSDPYLIHYPRISYFPFLLERLKAFFTPFLIQPDVPAHDGWLSFEDVPLKWHYPVGLLYDLFSGADPTNSKGGSGAGQESGSGGGTPELLPWKLELHFAEWPDEHLVRLDQDGRVMHDAFINSVKEADYMRNGTAKGIMSLSKEDSTQLWTSVRNHDLPSFSSVNQKLLNPPGSSLRHIPLKIYIPSSPTDPGSNSTTGSLRVVQALITPSLSAREPQTLGTTLNTLLPSLFPSRRTAILARPVLHGAVVPLGAPIEEVMRGAAYADGWVHLGIMMMG